MWADGWAGDVLGIDDVRADLPNRLLPTFTRARILIRALFYSGS